MYIYIYIYIIHTHTHITHTTETYCLSKQSVILYVLRNFFEYCALNHVFPCLLQYSFATYHH